MSKYQNSLNLLKNWAKNDRKAFSPIHWENIKKHSKNLQELVEKETPKKVVYKKNHVFPKCPVCTSSVLECVPRCFACGQRLNWSEVDEK